MFARDKIVAVNSRGEVKTTAAVALGSKAQVQASIGANGTFSTSNVSSQFFSASQYNYFMSGLLPATPDLPDSTALQYFYRDIYMHDNIAGSAVDIQSTFPFSDWELMGLEDNEKEVYDSALARLNLQELLPQLSTAYLVDGFYCGSLIYDAAAKNFMDILTHDALQCGVSPSPLNNVDPTVRVSVSGPTLRFLDSATDYAKAYIKTMPRAFVSLLKEGSFILDQMTTLWLGRRGLTDRAYQSYLHRVLPMYLIEKTMYRGTLVEAQRRQRAMSHITAGDDIWTPTGQELQALVQQFMDAEKDPLGGWISTRGSIQVNDLRPGGDFWKWTDMADSMVPAKLRALCMSEAFLSQDSTYSSNESAYSVFLETTNGYRTHLTNSIFYKKLFPLIAISNGFFVDPKKRKKTDSLVDFMFNASNRQNLKIPVLHWHKDLTARSEDNMMDMLEKLETHGVPVPLKMWLAAAGVDKDTLIKDTRENEEIKKEISKFMKLPDNVANGEGQGDGDSEFDTSDDSSAGSGSSGDSVEPTQGQKSDAAKLASALSEWNTNPTTASVKSGMANWTKGILNREFSHEEFTTTVTGKKKAVIHNPRGKATDTNWRIAQIAAKVEADPHYRRRLAEANKKKLGSSILKNAPGF